MVKVFEREDAAACVLSGRSSLESDARIPCTSVSTQPTSSSPSSSIHHPSNIIILPLLFYRPFIPILMIVFSPNNHQLNKILNVRLDHDGGVCHHHHHHQHHHHGHLPPPHLHPGSHLRQLNRMLSVRWDQGWVTLSPLASRVIPSQVSSSSPPLSLSPPPSPPSSSPRLSMCSCQRQ